MTLSVEEKIAALQLIRSTRIGPVTFWNLLRLHGTAGRALEALPHLALRGGARAYEVSSRSSAEAELETMQRSGGKFLYWKDPEFPKLLRALPDCPPILSFLGKLSVLEKCAAHPIIALVGARNASLNAQKFTKKLAEDLGKRGVVIVSGLARGIDGQAHWGSLSTGTCAVLAGGVDIIYPPENATLYAQVKASGMLLSEMSPGTTPQAAFFPRRNRIIAGMSHGIVVIEAALRSGSLITARFALDYNREVFSVPGAPFDPRCRGTNALLKDGATLVENADDVMQALELSRPVVAQDTVPLESTCLDPIPEHVVDSARERLLAFLSVTPTPLTEVLEVAGFPVSAILTALVELEIAGRVRYTAGQYVCLDADAVEIS